MNKKKGVLSLILTAALIILLAYTCIVGFGPTGTGAAKNIKLGLDLAGGVSITYQVKDENPTDEQMSDTIYKLQRRVEQYSTEATVYQEGDDRISIEIPGVTDANAILEELGQPGNLEFQTSDGETVLTGADVATASARSGQDDMGNTEYTVELDLTDEGAQKFADATEANVGNQIAIIYDGETISSPVVNEAITGGTAYITGDFTYEEAENLASTIRIGGLQLGLEELRSNVVGAQLGEQAVSTSVQAGAVGLALVFVFMCFVYLLPGLASSLALLIYTGIVLETGVMPDTAPEKIKDISSADRSARPVTAEEIRLWKMVADYYLCTLGEVFKAAYPLLKISQQAALARMRERDRVRTERMREQLEARIRKAEASLATRQEKLEKYRNHIFMIQHRHWTFHLELRAIQI